jgi:hypothetical protein
MASTDLRVPGYSDLSEVTRGGFATIYRAWQPTFEREVAIKVLLGKADDTSVRRFGRECAAIGALSGHPNIVTVYEAGTTEDGRLFIVMEFLHGGSLADRLAERGPFEVGDVLDIGARVAGAVESAHRADILHRDLKPENILLSRLGEPKVADFGLAQLPGATPTGAITGTIAHAAPEVLAGEEPTVASDIYSLSSTLFCLLAGRPPFAQPGDSSLVAIVARITHDPPPDLRSRGIPDALCCILEQGLAKVPAHRQHDVGQLGRQLQAAQVALGHPITPLPLESAAPARAVASVRGMPTPRARRGRRWLRLTCGVLLGAAAVVSLALSLTRDRASPLPVLYQDNFDAGQNWYEHDDDGATLSYNQGRYRILVKRLHHVVQSDTSFRGGVYGEPLTALTDVSVRVRVEAVSPGSIFGLFCRYGSGGDHYQAVVRTDGEALILRSQANQVKTLASTRVANVTGRYVSLQLDCSGTSTSRITLFADGRRVAEATDRSEIRQGSVGMVASTENPPGEVLFEDFVLRGRRQSR